MQNARFRSAAIACVLSAISVTASGQESKDVAIQRDRLQIEGQWRIVALTEDGHAEKEEDVREIIVINGSDGTWSLRLGAKEISAGTSVFDPTQHPKTIDFTPTLGEGQGNTLFGIYELGEQTRKLCFAPAGKPRPTTFAAPEGSENILVRFERVNP